jgi:hypothetical protein
VAQTLPLAKRTLDPDLSERISFRLTTMQGVAAEFEKTKEAIALLKTAPNDPAANLAVGRFYAAVASLPAVGLPMLAKGVDPLLKDAATRDLANPVTAADQLAAAEAWVAAAKAQAVAGAAKDWMQRRALSWYDASAAQETGLARSAVAKRATELRVSRLQRGGLLGEYFNGIRFNQPVFTRVDPRIEYKWNGGEPEASLHKVRYTVRWTGYLKATAGQYELVIVHDDALRLWLDGNLIVDKWTSGAFRTKALLLLTGGYQELKIEYAQFSGDSHVGLGWIPSAMAKVKGVKAKPIPPEMLYHEPPPPGPVCVRPPGSSGDRVLLAPKTARINGFQLQYSMVNGRLPELLGMWTSMSSYPSWDFEVRTGGDYAIMASYCSDGARAGSTYDVTVSGRHFPGTFANTGGVDGEEDFKEFQVGVVHLAPGCQTLQLQATSKRSQYVPAVQKMELVLLK